MTLLPPPTLAIARYVPAPHVAISGLDAVTAPDAEIRRLHTTPCPAAPAFLADTLRDWSLNLFPAVTVKLVPVAPAVPSVIGVSVTKASVVAAVKVAENTRSTRPASFKSCVETPVEPCVPFVRAGGVIVTVPETGTAVAINCVSVSGPETVTVPPIETGCVVCQKVPDTGTVPPMLTGTAAALSWVSVSGPVTVTLDVIETGCVACQKVPDTGTGVALNSVFVSGPETDTVAAIETGWVACQNVPVTGIEPEMLTG
jgi:hypothetical protein